MGLYSVELSGTTDGDGDATVNGEAIGVRRLVGVQVNLSALAATADTVISMQSTDDEAVTMLTLTDSQADAYYVVSPAMVNTLGSAITDAHGFFVVSGKPRVVVAQGGATAAFSVILYFED